MRPYRPEIDPWWMALGPYPRGLIEWVRAHPKHPLPTARWQIAAWVATGSISVADMAVAVAALAGPFSGGPYTDRLYAIAAGAEPVVPDVPVTLLADSREQLRVRVICEGLWAYAGDPYWIRMATAHLCSAVPEHATGEQARTALLARAA